MTSKLQLPIIALKFFDRKLFRVRHRPLPFSMEAVSVEENRQMPTNQSTTPFTTLMLSDEIGVVICAAHRKQLVSHVL